MSTFYSKIERIEKDLHRQYGEFILFSLVKLKITPKKWDVVVCADWLPKRQKEAIRFVVNELKKTLSEDDFLHISGIVVLDKNEEFVKEVQSLTSVEKGKNYKNLTVSNLTIKEMRVLQIKYSQEINSLEQYIAELVKQQIEQVKAEMYQSYLSSKDNFVLSETNEDKVTFKQSNNVIDFQEEYEKRKVERWQTKNSLLNN